MFVFTDAKFQWGRHNVNIVQSVCWSVQLNQEVDLLVGGNTDHTATVGQGQEAGGGRNGLGQNVFIPSGCKQIIIATNAATGKEHNYLNVKML